MQFICGMSETTTWQSQISVSSFWFDDKQWNDQAMHVKLYKEADNKHTQILYEAFFIC